jgi:dephospho-CoA kinase
MLRIGLTGGIASGKSTVADELRRLGVPVVDADQLARQVVEPGQPALNEIVASFGPEVLDPEGRLDRAALGRIVFNDPGAKARLEAITHPRIARAAAAEMARQAEAGERIAAYEAALIYEAGIEGLFDAVVVVAARPETQIARIIRRDGLGEAQARARLEAQMPTGEKVSRADHVIWTDGSLYELRAKVEQLYGELLGTAEKG